MYTLYTLPGCLSRRIKRLDIVHIASNVRVHVLTIIYFPSSYPGKNQIRP